MDSVQQTIKAKLVEIGIPSATANKFANNLVEKGWDQLEQFKQITDEQLRECGFQSGHINKFRKHYPPPGILFTFYSILFYSRIIFVYSILRMITGTLYYMILRICLYDCIPSSIATAGN